MKNCLHRLSLIHKSDRPPSLQALGEIQLDNLDEDVVSVVGDAPRASATTSSGLAFGVHRARIRRKEIRKSGNLDLEGQKIWNGWPANHSRFFAKSQKVGLEKIWRR
jgi:hypothetical protein